MTSVIDPKSIGKPKRPRRHVRTLTGMNLEVSFLLVLKLPRRHCKGYTPETDESGKEKWPRGDEKVWKAGLRGVNTGQQYPIFLNPD